MCVHDNLPAVRASTIAITFLYISPFCIGVVSWTHMTRTIAKNVKAITILVCIWIGAHPSDSVNRDKHQWNVWTYILDRKICTNLIIFFGTLLNILNSQITNSKSTIFEGLMEDWLCQIISLVKYRRNRNKNKLTKQSSYGRII